MQATVMQANNDHPPHEDQRALILPQDMAPDRPCPLFFELRQGDANRFVHFVIRPEAGDLAFNDMLDGIWGTEQRHPLPEGFGPKTPVVLTRDGRHLCLIVAGEAMEWTIRAPNFETRAFDIHCEGLREHWIAPPDQMQLDDAGRIAGLSVAGCRLPVPAQMDPAFVLEQQWRAWQTARGWFTALAAHPDATSSSLPPPDPAVLALSLALLAPRDRFTLRVQGAAQVADLTGLARAGDVRNLSVKRHSNALNALVREPRNTLEAQPLTAAPVVRGTGARTEARAGGDAEGAIAGPIEGLDIVVALYNNAGFIDSCLDSLLQPLSCDTAAKTDLQIRVSVVDDGSTDDGPDRVRRRAAADARIRLLTKANGGCSSARNYGRLMSEHSHIAFVDADDLVDPGFFSALLRVARETGAPVVQGGYARFVSPGFSNTGPQDAGSAPWPDHRIPSPDHPAPDPLCDRSFGSFSARAVPVDEVRVRQAAIWRRVHARAHLDHHDLWFPEGASAFDDLGFEIALMESVQTVWAVFGLQHLYRQHPGQDVAQADARHFNTLWQLGRYLHNTETIGHHPNPETVATFLSNAAWSVGVLQSPIHGEFMASLAALMHRLDRLDPAANYLVEAMRWLSHPDFAMYLEREHMPDARTTWLLHPAMHRLFARWPGASA